MALAILHRILSAAKPGLIALLVAAPGFCLSQPSAGEPGGAGGDIVFAYEDTGTRTARLLQADRLAEALGSVFPGRRIVLKNIASAVFEETVKAQKIPFAITSASTAVTLMMRYGSVPLAVREFAPSDRVPSGGLLVARADRADDSLASLKDRRLALQADASFGLLQWLEGRLYDEKFAPDKFFKSILRTGNETPDVLDAVLTGKADVGLLQGCTLERLIEDGLLDPQALKPVAVLPQAGSCKASTRSYPLWVLSYASFADPGDVRRVAATAFSLPQDGGSRWGVRVDLSQVQALMRSLHYGPYAYLGQQSFRGMLSKYKNFFFAAAAVILLLILNSLRTEYLVRRRTAELEAALQEKKRLERDAKVSRERLSAMERTGMLSQMSSMFAHELKQPLASVTYAVEGIKLWLRRVRAAGIDTSLPEGALDSAQKEAQRAAAIVERVRGYAKAHLHELKPVDWTKTVRSAVEIVERHDSECAPIRIVPGEFFRAPARADAEARVLGEPLELELLTINLVRNASQAVFGREDALVTVSLGRGEPGKYVLRVADNGPALDDAAFERLSACGDSIKSEGLGIGLSICRGIADRHGAVLHFRRLPGRGICAEVTMDALPPAEEEKKE